MKKFLMICLGTLMGINFVCADTFSQQLRAYVSISGSVRHAVAYLSGGNLPLNAEEKAFVAGMERLKDMFKEYELDQGTELEKVLKELKVFSNKVVEAHRANKLQTLRELISGFDIKNAIIELKRVLTKIDEENSTIGMLSFSKQIFGIKSAYANTVDDIDELLKLAGEAIKSLPQAACQTKYGSGAQWVRMCTQDGCSYDCCKDVSSERCDCTAPGSGSGHHGIWIGDRNSGECCRADTTNEIKRCLCKAKGEKYVDGSNSCCSGETCKCHEKGGTLTNGVCCKDGKKLTSDGKWTISASDCGCPEGAEVKDGVCCIGEGRAINPKELDDPYGIPSVACCAEGERLTKDGEGKDTYRCCKSGHIISYGSAGEGCDCPSDSTPIYAGKGWFSENKDIIIACCKGEERFTDGQWLAGAPCCKKTVWKVIEDDGEKRYCGCPSGSEEKTNGSFSFCCKGSQYLTTDGTWKEDDICGCPVGSIYCDEETGECSAA